MTDRNILTSADRAEYFGRLEKWLIEVYAWQSFIATFPYYLASSHVLNLPTDGNVLPSVQNETNQQSEDNEYALRQRRTNESVNNQFQVPPIEGIEYRIPSVWKRFLAELIDSMILFLLKLFITFVAVDLFDFINFERYYFDMLQTNLRLDYKMALELTSGILVLELVHRVFVCVFEASWLQRGRNGRIGGATPGKSLLGLKVVLCRNVTPITRLENNTDVVLVTPGTDLGLSTALGRSCLKNLILAFFFPICFALCFFRFNRTGYDLVCNTIVVEDTQRNVNNNIHNNINNNLINNDPNQERPNQQ